MTRKDAVAFASEWAAAWNDLAIERVLGHFDEDVVFTSPTAVAVVGVGTVRGKTALRAYWTAAVAQLRSLRFTVERALWDPETRELAILYVSVIDGRTKRVSENLTFGSDGLVVSAEVFHGVTGEPAP
jgi:ketosteroid isomerase-like protein